MQKSLEFYRGFSAAPGFGCSEILPLRSQGFGLYRRCQETCGARSRRRRAAYSLLLCPALRQISENQRIKQSATACRRSDAPPILPVYVCGGRRRCREGYTTSIASWSPDARSRRPRCCPARRRHHDGVASFELFVPTSSFKPAPLTRTGPLIHAKIVPSSSRLVEHLRSSGSHSSSASVGAPAPAAGRPSPLAVIDGGVRPARATPKRTERS